MRRLTGLAILLLAIVAGVTYVLTQQSGTTPTTTVAEAAPSTTEAVTPATEASTTTVESTTTSSMAESTTVATIDTTTEDTVPPEPIFAVTELQFGDSGFVAIRNVGLVAGDLGGYAVCSRPAYFQIPSVVVEPLEVVWLAVGDGEALRAGAGGVVDVIPMNDALGSFDRNDGELALYRSSAFDNPEAMITYVQWGAPGHGRESVAVEAMLWVEGAIVEVPDDAFGIQSIAPPDRPAAHPAEWVAGVGG